jgi:hypothetical protein
LVGDVAKELGFGGRRLCDDTPITVAPILIVDRAYGPADYGMYFMSIKLIIRVHFIAL